MCYVYILWSQSLDQYYIGSSSDPERRVYFHNVGKSGGKRAFTKRASDWKIAWKKLYESREEALRAEKKIKQQKSRTYIEEVIRTHVPG